MSEQLRPCPFCGSDDLQIYKPDCNPAREAWIACLSCSQLSGSVEGAIKSWNARAESSELKKYRGIVKLILEHSTYDPLRQNIIKALNQTKIEGVYK